MFLPGSRGVTALVLVNFALQLFDGVATYVGLGAGYAEGNPLLVWAFERMGPASALCLFKLEACACLLLVWHLRRSRLAVPALTASAVVYASCSLAPWTAALATLYL
jgi:uncharacterized membrane protein